LIKPVHDRLAQLLYLASNQKFEMKNCYFYIVTVFSQLFVFASRKEAICHLMEWSDYDEQAQTHLRNYTNAQIDFILDHMPLV
jgi:hypothetical protein